jgi:hypothetical protein
MPNSESSVEQPVCLRVEEISQEVRDFLISLPVSLESQKTQVFLIHGINKVRLVRVSKPHICSDISHCLGKGAKRVPGCSVGPCAPASTVPR